MVTQAGVAQSDWVIDGMLGIGLTRPLDAGMLLTVQHLNEWSKGKWVVSVDIPSGLSADTGMPMPDAVVASQTVTFGFLKRGLVTGRAAEYVGKVDCVDLGLPHSESCARLFEQADAKRVLPKRSVSGHKGNYGHVCVWVGDHPDKEGAPALSCLGALKSGAGLVTALGSSTAIQSIRPRLIPEIMTESAEIARLTMVGGVLVVGPGMGTDEGAWTMLSMLLRSKSNLVLDADALTLLARHKDEGKSLLANRGGSVTVMTPHPKEAARLLAKETSEIQSDRFAALSELVATFGVTVLLKGKGTLIGAPLESILVVTAGDSGLSKGGTGDVLSGIIAAFCAQMKSTQTAAALGAYVHGRTSEILSEGLGTERSTLASEVANGLPLTFQELE